MQTINQTIADRTEAIKQVADTADELLDYFYTGLGLTRPTKESEE